MEQMKSEIQALRQSLKTLEDKYDIEILVKSKKTTSVLKNNRGKIMEFLKLD